MKWYQVLGACVGLSIVSMTVWSIISSRNEYADLELVRICPGRSEHLIHRRKSDGRLVHQGKVFAQGVTVKEACGK